MDKPTTTQLNSIVTMRIASLIRIYSTLTGKSIGQVIEEMAEHYHLEQRADNAMKRTKEETMTQKEAAST